MTIDVNLRMTYPFLIFEARNGGQNARRKTASRLRAVVLLEHASKLARFIDRARNAPPGVAHAFLLALTVDAEWSVVVAFHQPEPALLAIIAPWYDCHRLVQIIALALLLVCGVDRFFDNVGGSETPMDEGSEEGQLDESDIVSSENAIGNAELAYSLGRVKVCKRLAAREDVDPIP